MRAVGVNAIAAQAGVAKMTLYHNYLSKDGLALAFLRERERRWTRDWLAAEAERRGRTPEEKLLAIFDLLDEWSRRPDFEGCPFIRAVLEYSGQQHPVRRAAVQKLGNIRSFVQELALRAGLSDPAEFAAQWQILMIGSIVAAEAGDRNAARRATGLARRMLGKA